jgi:hypothetical protein
MPANRASELLVELIDGWCERRALAPLALLLPAYTSYNGLTDGTAELYHAVNNLRGLGPGVLSDSELDRIAQLHSLIWQTLKSSSQVKE